MDGTSTQDPTCGGPAAPGGGGIALPKYHDPNELKDYFSNALPAVAPAFWAKVFTAFSDKDIVTINNRGGSRGIPITFPTLCFNLNQGGDSQSEGAVCWLRWREIPGGPAGDYQVEYSTGNVTDDSGWADIASNSDLNDKYLLINNGGAGLPVSALSDAKKTLSEMPDPILGWSGDDACDDCNDGDLRNVTVTIYH